MCYDIQTKLELHLKRAKHYGDKEIIKRIQEELKSFENAFHFHANAYTHPQICIYTNYDPIFPNLAIWGLNPVWLKSKYEIEKIWNKSLNARSETVFEKNMFKAAIREKRCVIPVNGFFEHYHFMGNKFPLFIQNKNEEAIYLAGIWSEFIDKETGELMNSFCILTQQANEFMKQIHNNPKLKEARMPFMLHEKQISIWLHEIDTENKLNEFSFHIHENEELSLKTHAVQSLRGKKAIGNQPEVSDKKEYSELETWLSQLNSA